MNATKNAQPASQQPGEPEPQPVAEIGTIKPELHEYVRALQADGFTVYGPTNPRRRYDGAATPSGWFHYSREVETPQGARICFGTFSDGSDGFDGASHSMPLRPSRLNGSGAHVGAKWGDPDTLGMDALDAQSVGMARIVARPANWCPFNAEPTPEATRRANAGFSVPQKFYNGAMLQNAEPWGIGTHYAPLPAIVAEAAE